MNKCDNCKELVDDDGYSHADYEKFGKVLCWGCIGVEK